jgi:hypothetical protein
MGAITAAIPSRSVLTARLRMPFWLLPGDLLLALPLLALAPDTYAKMAVVAANGGLIPWQAGIAPPLGRCQFVLGREVGVALYGLQCKIPGRCRRVASPGDCSRAAAAAAGAYGESAIVPRHQLENRLARRGRRLVCGTLRLTWEIIAASMVLLNSICLIRGTSMSVPHENLDTIIWPLYR